MTAAIGGMFSFPGQGKVKMEETAEIGYGGKNDRMRCVVGFGIMTIRLTYGTPHTPATSAHAVAGGTFAGRGRECGGIELCRSIVTV